MQKVNLIFAARLTQEKWFDLVIDFCHAIKWTPWEENVMIHVFGDGILKSMLPSYPWVKYYGQQPKEVLMKVRKECDYSLMPSRFLETFGLSALDSLTVWVPVIGFVRWWLKQFSKWMIAIEKESEFISWVLTALENINTAGYDLLSKNCVDIASQFTREQRKTSFEALIGIHIKDSSYLMISDYDGKIWWIESYIYQVMEKLKDRNASSTRFISAGSGTSILNKIFLFVNVFNKRFVSHTIDNAIKKDQPEVIWRHSIQRALGSIPFQKNSQYSWTKQILMIHDFGLIFPFPSQLHSEEQLLDSLEFSSRRKAAFETFWGSIVKKILRFIPLFIKFRSSKKLLSTIQESIDIVLVPSEYMKKYFEQYFPWKVEVLAHAL